MKNILLIQLLLFVLLTGKVSPEDFQGGTQSPLRFGVGARELSLGGAAVASCDAATAPFWNPARLANAEYISFSGFHTRLYDTDVSYQYAGIALPTLDFGTFGLGVQKLGIDNIEQRNSDNLLTGEFQDSRYGVYAGYGRYWGSYQIGISIGIEYHSLDNYSASSSPIVNIATMRSFVAPVNWIENVDFVLTANNIFQSSVELEQESIKEPSFFESAISLDLFPSLSNQHQFELSANLNKVSDLDLRASLGLEYMYSEMISARVGYNSSNISMGLGIDYNLLNFDYALVERDLGVLHMFAVTTTFGASVSERFEVRNKRREIEFQDRMHQQLVEKNKGTIKDLLASGELAKKNELYSSAVDDLDRALFIARSSGFDTTSIVQLLTEATNQLVEQNSITEHDRFLDSAQYYYDEGQLLNARYFCGLALGAVNNSISAQELQDDISLKLTANLEQEKMIDNQIRQIDSLLTYGEYAEAVSRSQAVLEIIPDNELLTQLYKRARFEDLRQQGERSFSNKDYELTNRLLVQVENLYPDHQWTLSLKNRLNKTLNQKEEVVLASKPKADIVYTEAAKKQAEESYANGQKSFEQGNFEQAISHWEQVEKLIPSYQSVRKYLVEAYKYLGVEHYSNNELKKALDIWQKASLLVPENKEIAAYIKRTEAELAKIKELTYEQ